MNAVRTAGIPLPDQYRGWNDAIIDDLFPRGRVGAPVYLAVHDGMLEELGERRRLGGRDAFISAVLSIGDARRLFLHLERFAELWDGSGRQGPPPFVAGLGLAVLAATDMATDETATQANYYFRLNTLIGERQNRERPERFDATIDLWKSLQSWLREERRGELVVRGLDGPRRFVDPVKSQCLVRTCDVEELASLLRVCRREEVDEREPDELADVLKAWLATTGARSRLSMLLGREPDDTALHQAAVAISDLLDEESAQLTSVLPATSRSPSTPATYAVRPNRYPNLRWRRAEWLVRLPADADADEMVRTLRIGEREATAKLDLREPAAYDLPLRIDEFVGLARGELKVFDESTRDVTPRFTTPVWFEDGARRGRPGSWNRTEVPRAESEYVLVAASNAGLDEFRRAIERTQTTIEGTSESWPGPGFVAGCEVKVRAGATLPNGVPVPSRVPLLRMYGGLHLRRRVYLRGGLPRLDDGINGPVRVIDEGGEETVLTSAAGFSSLPLPEGRFRVRSAEAEADIFVVEPRWDELQVPSQVATDAEVTAALVSAHLRGPSLSTPTPFTLTFFSPGTTYRVYAPHMVKGVAPADGGVHEVRTAQIPQVTIMRRAPALPPLRRAACFESRTAEPMPEAASAADRKSALEILLKYASARGHGGLELLRGHCVELVDASESWHAALSALEDLGHIDVSWESRRWAVTPPTLVQCAREPERSFLVGARSTGVVEWFARHGLGLSPAVGADTPARVMMPSALQVQTSDARRIEDQMRAMGVAVLASPSLAIAAHARPISTTSWWAGAQFTPSSLVHRSLEQWQPDVHRWRAVDGEPFRSRALYRWREQGVRIHYIVAGALRCRVKDPAAAKWFLHAKNEALVVYERAEQRLLVPSAIGLPRVLRRACVLASGLMPQKLGRTLAYDGVPLDLARAVAVRLNQSRGEGLW